MAVVIPFSQHAFPLRSNGRALSATCFAPEIASGAVLFLLPFAEERKGALPVFVQTARRLAADGIASLMFDFSGCGDSTDDFEAVPPETFETDAENAFAWLSAAFPSHPVALLGLRTGAALARRLAARHPETAALVLWAPVAGVDFLRQLLQRRLVNDMVAYGRAQESRSALEAGLRTGQSADLDGYTVTGPFYAWLQTLTLDAASAPSFLASGGHDEKPATACATGATDITRFEERFPPFWNTVGRVELFSLVRATCDWLVQRIRKEGETPARQHPTFDTHAAKGSTAPTGFLSFGAPDAVIRAALDHPHGDPAAGALFLHGWSGDRTGPHRLFVRFARRLAREGTLCLRPDFFGRGLSDGAAAEASIARMTRNAGEALDALKRQLPDGAPVTLVALCSGCKVALSLAAERPEAMDRLILWSPESMGSLRSPATGLRKTLHTLAAYARKGLRPETWKKLLSGNVRGGLVAKALTNPETRSAEEAQAEDASLRKLRAFRRPILFVYGGSDPDAPGSRRAYAAYCRKNGIPFTEHTIPHAGHSYYGEAWTRELITISITSPTQPR